MSAEKRPAEENEEIDINFQDKYGHTAIWLVMYRNQLAVAKILLGEPKLNPTINMNFEVFDKNTEEDKRQTVNYVKHFYDAHDTYLRIKASEVSSDSSTPANRIISICKALPEEVVAKVCFRIYDQHFDNLNESVLKHYQSKESK